MPFVYMFVQNQYYTILHFSLFQPGVYGLADMNKNEFPDFTVRQGVVVAVYPGCSTYSPFSTSTLA